MTYRLAPVLFVSWAFSLVVMFALGVLYSACQELR